MSSISNSPSSVRINQNYDPQDVKKQLSPTQTQTTTTTTANSSANNKATENNLNATNLRCDAPGGDDGVSSNDLELDNLEDADRKPLLNANSNNSPLSTNNKHTDYSSNDGSGNEKVALINHQN